MGFLSTVVIKNDALNAIDEDPKGWWETTRHFIQSHWGSKVKEYGFSSHSNGFEIASVAHADITTVIAVGQNHTTVLGQFNRQDHHTEEKRVELLKKLANDMGYRIVKKKKITP